LCFQQKSGTINRNLDRNNESELVTNYSTVGFIRLKILWDVGK